jgi:signal transduction histidine kinase
MGQDVLTQGEVKAGAGDAAAPPRLLVVDDEPGIRDLFEREFTGRGWSVFAAAGAREGVELARIRRPDVAVCDLSLPDGDGAEVLEAMKEIDPKLEVIVVTGHATLESALSCLRRGAYDYVTKPFRMEEVVRLADRALDRRRLSRQLVHLKELNRLKTDFIAGMSHELRTPLNAVIGFVSLLLDGAYGDLGDRSRQALLRVDVNARNLLQLINNILDVSKIGTGRMEIYPELFVLDELAREVADGMDSIVRGKGLRLDLRVPEGLRLFTDRLKTKQILINLVGNALKFTREGGVELSAERIPDGTAVRFSVKDTGVGIRPEDIPFLFQEFKQPDPAAVREFGGTGLGLAIVRKLTNILGGSVSVESELGKGSVFTVTLPVQGPTAAAEEKTP